MTAEALAAQMYPYYSVFALIFGLLVGSFLNVCIARMPEDRSVVHPPSHCPSCGHAIRPYDNIPVISWLILRAKCRDCGTGISSLYPTIELLTGLLAWLVFRAVIPGPEHLDLAHGVAFFFYFSFVAMMIAQSYIDIRHYIIPDEFSIYAVPYAVGGMALLTKLGYPGALSWQMSVLGAFFGGGSLGLVMLAYWLLRRREGMGLGDIKLMALIGAMVGAGPGLLFVIFAASIFGVMVGIPVAVLAGRGWRHALPFGPFLGLAAVIWLLHGGVLLERYMPGLDLLFPS